MKNSDLDYFVEHIFSQNQPKIHISNEFEKFILEKQKCTLLEAQEIIERDIPLVYKKVNQKINRFKKEFTIPQYDLSEYDSDKLIRSSFKYEKEKRGEIENKIKWREQLKIELEKLNWREFEFLSKYILKINRITDITITKSSKDQGIDFYGYFNFSDLLYRNRFQNDLKLRVVGQVKHSEKKVKVNHQKVSSFGTEIIRLRKKDPPNYFIDLPADFFQSPLPLVGIFITNTSYLPKAIDFAQEYGIIIWNGNQISEDLSNSDFIKFITEHEQLSLKKFRELLKEEI